MTQDELKEAVYNAASGSDNRRVIYGSKAPSEDAVLRLQRQILRFLEDVDPTMSVSELIDELRFMDPQ